MENADADFSSTAVSVRRPTDRLSASYILPIRKDVLEDLRELTAYLHWLDNIVELIVVDGSPAAVFTQHARAWRGLRHVMPNPEYETTNGKVWGVLTGLYVASQEKLIIADDDVRYDRDGLECVLECLDRGDVVRPQNYFQPLPWHARWDTARSLINRATGGDWPGTLGVRRSVLLAAGGYDGDCLFENLEMTRTVLAQGGREVVAQDVFVRRLPPSTRHFLSQRVRQAYDEFARPQRLVLQLALLPTGLLLAATHTRILLAAVLATIGIAEYGRRRAGGTRVFPASASLFAPLWLSERMVCSWLAVVTRLRGGVRYNNRLLVKAAMAQAALDRRYAALRGRPTEQVESAS